MAFASADAWRPDVGRNERLGGGCLGSRPHYDIYIINDGRSFSRPTGAETRLAANGYEIVQYPMNL